VNSTAPAQRKALEEIPPGSVLVIDSRKHARAASAGGILVSPDLGKLPFPAFHQRASAPTNLTLHQAIGINEPIGCGDAPVWPGDVVMGDPDGVIIVPAGIADEIATEAVEMTAFEDFVQEMVLEGRSILGLYPPTDTQSSIDFATWRAQNHR
jgi:regulator of RNase E activity RraA